MRPLTAIALGAALLLGAPRTLSAQGHAHEAGMMDMPDGPTSAGPHLTVTPVWPVMPGDEARADSIVRLAREALAQYADVSAAERAGYRTLVPEGVRKRTYHYSNPSNAKRSRGTFDVTRPTSLLYERQPDGKLRLIGAMYTAPASLTLAELNERIPLSVAQWHEHTNLCLPPGGRRALFTQPRDPRFGPGGVSTEAECVAAGGTFHASSRSWMVHANVFEPDAEVWSHRH